MATERWHRHIVHGLVTDSESYSIVRMSADNPDPSEADRLSVRRSVIVRCLYEYRRSRVKGVWRLCAGRFERL